MQRQLSFWQATRRFTVSQITHYLKELIDTDATLRDVWVEGEVSNYSSSAAGHMYFSLKDGEALLPCVMWRSQARKLSFIPSDGDHVLAHGYISVYTAGGRYQFYVDAIQPIGLGLLYVELEQLKARLAAEGIFDQARKRPIPPFPSRIGVVTSPFGAAIRDIIRVLGRRFPLAEVILSPTLVQGQEAPSQIVAAMELLNDYGQVDLIILARGGGSFEELMAFNDERVARAVASSAIPVICGVGHEIDYTLADMAADLRAPTPSAAAEMAVPDKEELLRRMRTYRLRLTGAMQAKLEEARRRLEREKRTLAISSPQMRINLLKQRVDELSTRLKSLLESKLEMKRMQVQTQQERLSALSPWAVLKRGYAVVSFPGGPTITSVTQVQTGDHIEIRVSDGQFGGVVEETTPPQEVADAC